MADFTGDGVLDLLAAGAAGARILAGTEHEPDRFGEIDVVIDAGALPPLRDAAPSTSTVTGTRTSTLSRPRAASGYYATSEPQPSKTSVRSLPSRVLRSRDAGPTPMRTVRRIC